MDLLSEAFIEEKGIQTNDQAVFCNKSANFFTLLEDFSTGSGRNFSISKMSISVHSSDYGAHQSEIRAVICYYLEITYIGWVSERLPEEHFEDPRQRWEPRFIILKGSELCIFESPPVRINSFEILSYIAPPLNHSRMLNNQNTSTEVSLLQAEF